MDKIKLLIADDHVIVREGIKTLMESEGAIIVVGEAGNGEEAVKKAIEENPDVILLDLMMPKMDGLQAIEKIITNQPDSKILVLTSFADDDKVFPAIKSGALGYLLKDSSPQTLIEAIYSVYRGETSLHPSIALKLIREINQPSELPLTKDPLTSREEDVLKLIAKGMTNQEIANELILSQGTVRTHVRNILSKLHLANRTQAALYALKEGLADLEP